MYLYTRIHIHACIYFYIYACEHLPPAVELVLLGSQAFYHASAFNANIGAWNTVSVTSLSAVCAAFGRRRATAAGALGRGSARRGTGGDGTADARAHVCVRTVCMSPPMSSCKWVRHIYI